MNDPAVEAMLDAARRATGLMDFGDAWFLGPLAAWAADLRALLRWELMEPVPPPQAATHGADPRIAAVQASADKLRGTLIERMHWVKAREPEECVWGFIDATGMLGQAAGLCLPRWWRFLCDEDPMPAYANYRRVVQLLLWQHPVGERGFLVLKALQVARHVRAFVQVFPEAQFVVTDRDPYRCLERIDAQGYAHEAALAEPRIDAYCARHAIAPERERLH